MKPREKHRSSVRAVTYSFIGEFLEGDMEKILEPAKRSGIVTEYDSGRGQTVWFSGCPGAALREVRARVMAVPGVSGALKRI